MAGPGVPEAWIRKATADQEYIPLTTSSSQSGDNQTEHRLPLGLTGEINHHIILWGSVSWAHLLRFNAHLLIVSWLIVLICDRQQGPKKNAEPYLPVLYSFLCGRIWGERRFELSCLCGVLAQFLPCHCTHC